jgi:hypothetical protein
VKKQAKLELVPPAQRGVTVKQLALETGFSTTTIREWMRDEPGVIVIDRPANLHRRPYCSMRAPRAVADRIIAKHARK